MCSSQLDCLYRVLLVLKTDFSHSQPEVCRLYLHTEYSNNKRGEVTDGEVTDGEVGNELTQSNSANLDDLTCHRGLTHLRSVKIRRVKLIIAAGSTGRTVLRVYSEWRLIGCYELLDKLKVKLEGTVELSGEDVRVSVCLSAYECVFLPDSLAARINTTDVKTISADYESAPAPEGNRKCLR